MNRTLALTASVWLTLASFGTAAPPKPWVTGIKNPDSVVVGGDGRVYVTAMGDIEKDGDGGVFVIEDDKAVPYAQGMDDPRGMVAFQRFLFVVDKTRVWRIDPKGKPSVHVSAKDFPVPPIFLNDIVMDVETGTLYVSDSGDGKGKGGAIFKIDFRGKVSLVADAKTMPALRVPNGIRMDGASFLLVVDSGTGELHRLNVADGTGEKIADGFGMGDGVVWDNYGRLYVSDSSGGKIFAINRPGEKPVTVAEGFQSVGDIGIDLASENLLVPDTKAGTITRVPLIIPGAEVDTKPLDIKTTLAFPHLVWAGWKGETDDGRVVPFRPLVLTHAGDGTNRVFVASEQGVVYVFPNDPKAAKTSIFIDLQDRVAYDDKTNEEGLLGLAFHPKFKQNGEFYVFYTPKNAKLTNVVSRFRVSKDDPNRADPKSEEEIIRFKKPYWNHNGGTICFGPDGFLYITHGDGGFKDDPMANGQSLDTLLGKILRIDVGRKEGTQNYGIPKDNPFVETAKARPEIWAYGLRNVWRMSFDRSTGQLWAADVGQNLYEEINLIQRGGNYGWSRREGLHPFGAKGSGFTKQMIDPIWEYNHDIGKSITGGTVYRGSRLPELQGCYLYGDYVANRLWALRYDDKKGRVVASQAIKDFGLPIYSFGEDEKGEVYVLTSTRDGKGIYWFSK